MKKAKKTTKKPDHQKRGKELQAKLKARLKAMTFRIEERKIFVITNEDGVVFPKGFLDRKTAETKMAELRRKFRKLDNILGVVIGGSAAALLFAMSPAPAYADDVYDMTPSVERRISDLQSQQSSAESSAIFDRVNMEYQQEQMQRQLDDQQSKLRMMPMDRDGD